MIAGARRFHAACLALAAFFLSTPAVAGEAEPTAELPRLPWGSFAKAPPGTWVEYATLVGGHPVAPFLRVLVVGDEVVDGEAGTWIEIWMSQRPGSATQAFRLLLSTNPESARAIRKARVRLLGGKVQDVPTDAWSRADPAKRGVAGGPGAPQLQSETTSLLTPAGSFPCRLAKAGDAKLWLSTRVPVFGLVRMEIPGRAGLELHAMGSGGRGVVEAATADAESNAP